ncbi:uncharacterized protein LOC129717701 isoform X1 [Wyeomyia smithii]|uniref:uncharacterized protein LOC129717701 isoform X1 n=1 Tax=Wyeomyia smithii TaxID=174621 RepID=UPI00246807FA|nr:uncharacterized protein LOC129717701 isoform X1 [Wyeomyia smithii]
MIFSGDLIFSVHLVVLFQCCWNVSMASTINTPPEKANLSTTTSMGAAVVSVDTNAQLVASGSINANGSLPNLGSSTVQKYRLLGELGQSCSVTADCRQYAYTCGRSMASCECAEGYRPDVERRSCVGAIGKRCQYDSHCITNAYCKGQMICTCKREFEYLSEDKWSCQASAADSLLLHRKSTTRTSTTSTWLKAKTLLLAALQGSRGGAIIIPLLLVSSWQLKINLFTV